MSLTGGMDLSKLKPAAVAPVESVTVPSLAITVTESSLPSIVGYSKTVPIIFEFFPETPDPVLEQMVRAQSGAILLAKVNSTTDPRVAQAFGAKTSPSIFAMVKGQPIPVAEGTLTDKQYLAIIDQLISAAKAQGVSGRVVEGEVDPEVPQLPKPLQEALALVDSGEVDQAHALLTKLKAENPKDVPTSALLSQVSLMKRTMDLDHEAILASQPSTFDEAIVLADVLTAIGDFASSFEILLSLYPQVEPGNKDIVKARLLEYFEIAGPNNGDVKSARARLATLLY